MRGKGNGECERMEKENGRKGEIIGGEEKGQWEERKKESGKGGKS